MILGLFAMLTTSQSNLKHKPLPAIIFCVLIAASDETLQLFISGRSGQVTDVVLDSCGAMVGVLVMWLKEKMITWKSKK